jgi:hypothetical protein
MAMMYLEVVQYQINFATGILDQSCHEGNQAFTVHVFLVEHESDLTLVADGRDHIDPVLSGCLAKNRCLALRRVSLLHIGPGLNACFIAPVDFGLVLFRPFSYGWVLLDKPIGVTSFPLS